MNDKWMKDVKDLSSGFRKKAPEGLLDDIKQEMSRRGVMPASELKKASIVPMNGWQRVAALAALALASGVAIHEWNREIVPIQPAIVETEVEHEGATESWDEQTPQLRAEQLAEASSERTNRKSSDFQKAPSAMIPWHTEVQPDEAQRNEAVDEAKDDEAQMREDHTNSVTKDDDMAQNVTTHEFEHLAMNVRPKRNYRSMHTGWGIGAYYGGGGNLSLNSLSSSSGDYSGQAANPMAPQSDPVYGNNPPQEKPDELPEEKHHKPLRFGISVRYVLDERWSLLSGITYSYLHSDTYVVYGSTIRSAEQKLHYLGIPLAASYSIWQNDHVNVYAVAGGEIEKLVKGKLEIERASGINTFTESVKENRPVFSTNASAGIEYQTKKGVGLYAEPGASYHFDNGSGVHSAYTDKPWDFTISIGLRINLNE